MKGSTRVPEPVRVQVNFHLFTVGGSTDDEPLQAPKVCVIFEPLRTRTSVLSGVASGPVLAECQALLGPPAQLAGGWEDIAEVSLDVGDWALAVTGWSDEPPPPRLDAAGPGTYRVRVHASGRDTAWDAPVSEPVERFLVQAWPAPYESPLTVQAVSERAKSELRN